MAQRGDRAQARDLSFPSLMPIDHHPPEPELELAALERPRRREPLVVKEHEDIVLTATLATPSVAAVTWLKDGVEIRRSKRHEMASLGETHTLTVHGAQTLDSAVYSCRVGAEGQDFPVQVEGEWGHGVVLWESLVCGILEWSPHRLRAQDPAVQSWCCGPSPAD